MKIKTAELTGVVLDWAVAKIENHQWRCPWMLEKEGFAAWQIYEGGWGRPTPGYSTEWEFGGPIIERERIELIYFGEDGMMDSPWESKMGSDIHYIDQGPGQAMGGPTPLIAAMRCYVASKLGDEVDVPGELV